MRGNLVVGMVTGSVIGAVAAMIAMPYLRPQIDRAVKRGKRVINAQIDKMTTGS